MNIHGIQGAQQAVPGQYGEARVANHTVPYASISTDPISGLIATNQRLQAENLTLRQQIYEHEKQPRLNLPDWAIDPLTSTPSLMGLLVLRMQRVLQYQAMFHNDTCNGKFSYKNIVFIEAVADGILPECSVHAFIVVNSNPMLLQDKLGMWPSDSFLTKILTLAGDQPEPKF